LCKCIPPNLEPPPTTIAHDVQVARAQIAEALAAERQGDIEKSLDLAREARAAADRLEYRPVQAEALVQIACALDGQQTAKARNEAEVLYFVALEVARAAGHDQLVAVIWRRLVLLAIRMDPGTRLARDRMKNLEEAVDRIGNCACRRARLHHLRGEIHYRDGHYADAADENARAIEAIAGTSDDQVDRSGYYHALAKCLDSQGHVDQALRLYEQAKQMACGAANGVGPSLHDLAELHMNHGLALKRKGDLKGARSQLQAAQAKLPAACHNASLNAGVLRTFLSDVAYQEDDAAEALEHGREALEIYKQVGAPKHRLAEALTNIGNAELKRKNARAALAAYEAALDLRRPHLDNYHYQVGVNHGSIAETLMALSQHEAAADHLDEAERILLRVSPDNREVQDWLQSLRLRLSSTARQHDADDPPIESTGTRAQRNHQQGDTPCLQ
jgi:tetratricopeptide (TPR) repeat protein